MKKVKWVNCAACGAIADRAVGVFLERLYPSEFFCRGCGRRTLHCSCAVGAEWLRKAA